MHKCTSYGPDKLNIRPFWPLFDPCDFDLQPTWKNVSNGTSPPRGQQLCKIILKSMHKCTSYGRTSSVYDHFDIYLTPVTLTFNLPEKMFQMALLLLEGNNCAKSFWNLCINVQVTAGQAQYMTILTFIWPLWPWPSTYLKMFQMELFVLRGNNCAKLFWNPCIIVQVMVRTNPDGWMQGRTDPRTHTHTLNKNCNNYVSLTHKRARQ